MVPMALSHHPPPPLLPRIPTHHFPFHSPLRASSRVSAKFLRRAVGEWQEYEEAVKRKDLAKALRFLTSLQPNTSTVPSSSSATNSSLRRLGGGLDSVDGLERDWEVLDTCMNADDMRLVAAAYDFLGSRGFLPSFGKFRSIVLEGPREITPTVLKSSTGLEVTKFAPKKWGVSGVSSIVSAAFLGGTSLLLWQGIDVRTSLTAVLGLALLDNIFLGGSCLAQISSYWPPYRRRILVHEAGHLLVAYLMGCPIRGVILDPIVAVQMGIQGQAGTQFWDEKMSNELAIGQLSGATFDRYSMVLFAGIAAETLVYGEAEGGENDENLFRSISVLLEPPLSVAQMSNQARWSVLQAYNLLKWHKEAHTAAYKAMESGGSLSVVIRRIEETINYSRR
ncbi:hypothetical protein LINPERHAP1_LOCUS16887 [Linum perenne]